MALAATLVGFGLLVVALVTGTLWLAIACIVVCVVGGVFLLADLLGLGDALTLRRTHSATPTDPDETATDETDPSGHTASDAPEPEKSTSGISDSEVTTEFPRVPTDEPVVSLGDEQRSGSSRHGRHESDGAAPGTSRPPRHGSPDR